MMHKKILISILAYLLWIGCATVNAESPTQNSKETEFLANEKYILKIAEDEEKKLDESGIIYQDLPLTSYLNEIALELVKNEPNENLPKIKVKVLKDPELNAASAPTGTVYITTGLLSKMENEAELATLLGHEISHTIKKHMIKGYTNTKENTSNMAALGMIMSPFLIYGIPVVLLGSLSTAHSISGYSQDLEREADKAGLYLMVRAGYDPQEAPKLFMHLKTELEEQKTKERYFFGSHPHLQERFDSYEGLIKTEYSGVNGKKGQDGFVEKLTPLIFENMKMDLSAGRFESAIKGIGRILKYNPKNARAHYYFGEVYRQRGKESDLNKCKEEYRAAGEADTNYPEPHRMLGLVLLKEGKFKEAKIEFEAYLKLLPSAGDREYIESYLEEIGARL